jgi:hypothetical protein
MTRRGKSPAEAWERHHQALRSKLEGIPRRKHWQLRTCVFSNITEKIINRRARQRQKARSGDFEVLYVVGNSNDFDQGVDYLQCGNLNVAVKSGGEAFASSIRMSDIALSDAMEWGLRTQTLTDGCRYNDFRIQTGAPTLISSKTPAVQAAIDRIRNQEAEHGAAPHHA